MKRSDLTYIVGSVFAAMTCFFYFCVRWLKIKLPRYYPVEHTWKMVKEKGVCAQAWYSVQILVYLLAGITALAVYLYLKRSAAKDMKLTPVAAKWLGVLTTVIIVACMGYIVYNEYSKWGIL